jgi:dihydrofolate synthase/folylpolyglutamate synthase
LTAYQAALEFLHSRIDYERSANFPYRSQSFTLDRMCQLAELLGNPQRGLPVVHIAGTKGKGSTASMVAGMLHTSGIRNGLYVSPHLERLEERLVVDGAPCSEETLAALVQQVRPAVEELDRRAEAEGERSATYFEITTVMAFLFFAQAEVELAVMEVGLGGRLDSTNICDSVVCAITSISYDHTQQLGDTLTLIAGEKAGICKPGVPIVCGVRNDEAQAVIHQRAADLQAPLWQLDRDFFVSDYQPCRESNSAAPPLDRMSFRSQDAAWCFDDLDLALPGKHQADNASVAIAIVQQLADRWPVLAEDVRQGLATTACPARVEVISHKPLIVLDAAHNVASSQALVDTLRERFGKRRRLLVFATTLGKDVAGMLEILLPEFDDVVLTKYSNNPRSVSPDALHEAAQTSLCKLNLEHPPSVTTCADATAATALLAEDTSSERLVCVTGSFFIAGEMKAALGKIDD